MLGKKNQSAVLAKYFGMYKKNPRSKVFAPLAESFRKLGMLDDAFKILKEGIRNHPNYTLGYIVLANCYYDQEKFELTYNTLRPIVAQNADNISLQKIFAQACMHLGHLEEALDTYKYLLFMNPKEKFFAEQVKKLEDDLFVGHKKLSLDQIVKAPDMSHIPTPQSFDDDWVQVDFGKQQDAVDTPKLEEPGVDQWEMRKSSQEDEPKVQTPFEGRSLEDDYFADEFSTDGDIDESNESEVSNEAPIVSHTLIDLYCAQKYFDKAIELLEKIIELNPRDQSSIEKLKQVKQLASSNAPESSSKEEDGHAELISIIENQVKAKSPKELKLEETFGQFLHAIKDRSQHYR